jgi:hypothetical protein
MLAGWEEGSQATHKGVQALHSALGVTLIWFVFCVIAARHPYGSSKMQSNAEQQQSPPRYSATLCGVCACACQRRGRWLKLWFQSACCML